MADINAILPGLVLTKADGQAYKDASHRWCENAEKEAKYIVQPKSAEDVSKAIKFATANGLDLAIKGGGHSCSGASSSEGGLVIDLAAHLNTVVVDADKKLIKVGGGATWAPVDEEAAKHGLATVGGTVNHTGVGGLTVGGGYGWLSPKYGLAIDNLVEAEVVLANGEIVTASETSNPDLFWAIRGAGSNFGPVTSFTFKAYPQTNTVWSGLLVFPPPALDALFNAADTWLKTAGPDESGIIFIACPPPAFQPTLVLIPFYNGSAEDAKKKFAAFYDVGPVADMTAEMPYSSVNGVQNPMATHGDRKLFKATAFTSLKPARFQAMFDAYAQLTDKHPETKGSAIIIELHPHAKVTEVPNSATSFANRGPWYNINYSLRWKDAALDTSLRAWAAEQVETIRQAEPEDLAGTRAYANYGLGDERTRDVFGENYERLAQLKAKYDPNQVFKKWFPITPKA